MIDNASSNQLQFSLNVIFLLVFFVIRLFRAGLSSRSQRMFDRGKDYAIEIVIVVSQCSGGCGRFLLFSEPNGNISLCTSILCGCHGDISTHYTG